VCDTMRKTSCASTSCHGEVGLHLQTVVTHWSSDPQVEHGIKQSSSLTTAGTLPGAATYDCTAAHSAHFRYCCYF
jgi:hypothetical protein